MILLIANNSISKEPLNLYQFKFYWFTWFSLQLQTV